jgi:outer membrane protein
MRKYAIQNISIGNPRLDTKTANIDKKRDVGNFHREYQLLLILGTLVLNQGYYRALRNQNGSVYVCWVNVGVDIYKGLQNQNTLRKPI